MDFDFPPDDDLRRLEVRAWIDTNPKPSSRDLVDAGFVATHWHKPYGFDAEPIHQLIIAEELKNAVDNVPS